MQSIIWSIIEKLISVLPKIISGRLYQEKRTVENIKINVSAQEGSCEIYCSELSTFTIWLEILNNNPFWIDIDRIFTNGTYNYSAKLYAENIIGGEIESNKSKRFLVKGNIDPSQVKKIKEAPEQNASLNNCEIEIVLYNRYTKIRYRNRVERLMCKVINKKV